MKCLAYFDNWQLREVAIDDGVKATEEFLAWLQFCHDRRLLFCDSISTTSSESTDTIVVLRPAWLLEACQNLLSDDSRCCIQVHAWCLRVKYQGTLNLCNFKRIRQGAPHICESTVCRFTVWGVSFQLSLAKVLELCQTVPLHSWCRHKWIKYPPHVKILEQNFRF